MNYHHRHHASFYQNAKYCDRNDLNIELHFEFFDITLDSLNMPQLINIDARSAKVKLQPIDADPIVGYLDGKNVTIEEKTHLISKFQNLIYTIELCCESSDAAAVLYKVNANEITLEKLKPATEYKLRVFAGLPASTETKETKANACSSSTSTADSLLTLCEGKFTEQVSFETQACVPNTPEPPKACISIKKTKQIGLEWQQPDANGSKIVSFTLQYRRIASEYGFEDFSSKKYRVAYRGEQKQFIVKNLLSSTLYEFRLQAENDMGASKWSSPTLIYTSGCIPEKLPQLRLHEATTNSLTLGWTIPSSATTLDSSDVPSSAIQLDYELQMRAVYEDNPYVIVYNGPMKTFNVQNLKQSTLYSFRVRINKFEECGPWSNDTRFKTESNADLRENVQSLMDNRFFGPFGHGDEDEFDEIIQRLNEDEDEEEGRPLLEERDIEDDFDQFAIDRFRRE